MLLSESDLKTVEGIARVARMSLGVHVSEADVELAAKHVGVKPYPRLSPATGREILARLRRMHMAAGVPLTIR